MNLITLFLTCGSREEAKKISAQLLQDKLAACVRQTDVVSDFLWKGNQEHGEEVLLIIDTAEEKFDRIEAVIKQIHNYDTFVLTAYPVSRASKGVEQWMKESLG